MDIIKTFDELNLIDWPLAIFGNDLDSVSKEGRTYHITSRDKISHRQISGFLRIYFISDESTNSLMSYDEDVLLALMSLAGEKLFGQKVMVLNNKNELLDRLGWSRIGRNYQKLQGSFRRLVGLTIETNLFYNKRYLKFEDRLFHIIDRITLFKDSYKMEIEWSDTIWDSISFNNFRPLNYSLYLKIKEPGAKKLFRVLDKRFYKRKQVEIPVEYLCINIIGMHHSKSINQMTKLLMKYSAALVDINYLGAFSIRKHDNKNVAVFAMA